jgi:hypothetical protein
VAVAPKRWTVMRRNRRPIRLCSHCGGELRRRAIAERPEAARSDAHAAPTFRCIVCGRDELGPVRRYADRIPSLPKI